MGLFLAGCKSETGSRRRADAEDGGAARKTTAESTRAKFLKDNGLQGRPALIEFGTIDCDESDKGLDRIMALHEKNGIRQLSYARVEAAKDPQAVREYYAAKSPSLPVCRDPDSVVAKAFNATAYPTFVLVDKFGRSRYHGKYPGARKLREWAGALAAEESDPGPDVPLFGAVTLDLPKLLGSTRLPDLSGKTKPLRAYMGPGGLAVVFVYTKCVYSRQAVTEVPAVAGTLAEHKVNTVLVNLDEPEETVRKFYAKHDTGTAPLLFDVTAKAKNLWHMESMPTVVFVDARERLAYKGKAAWKDVAVAVEGALGLPGGAIAFGAKGTGFQ